MKLAESQYCCEKPNSLTRRPSMRTPRPRLPSPGQPPPATARERTAQLEVDLRKRRVEAVDLVATDRSTRAKLAECSDDARCVNGPS